MAAWSGGGRLLDAGGGKAVPPRKRLPRPPAAPPCPVVDQTVAVDLEPAAPGGGSGRVRRALQRTPTSSQPGAATAARADRDTCGARRGGGPSNACAGADQRVFSAGCLTQYGVEANLDARPYGQVCRRRRHQITRQSPRRDRIGSPARDNATVIN